MGNKFAHIAFTPAVREAQIRQGSQSAMDAMLDGEDYHATLGANEIAFIASRDSFYLASVGESGWPYIQHRGGPAGFVCALGEKTIAFADFRGNRQYISLGNLSGDGRVCLFFMDYANRIRLKLFGRARVSTDAAALKQVELPGYRARVERAIFIDVEAFDWNCPQHIVQRYAFEDVEAATHALRTRIAELETQLAQARAGQGSQSK